MKNDQVNEEKRRVRSFRVSREGLKKVLKSLGIQLFTNKLVVDGKRVIIPRNAEIEYKIKYEDDDKYELTLKIDWKKEKHRCDNDCDDD